MTAKSEKAVNYTPEMTAKAVADYAAGVPVEAIAAEIGRTVRSVVAKLSREGVYKKKEYTTKAGTPVASKEEMVAQIANVMGTNAESLAGLEKANKTTLDALLKFMVGATE